MVPQKQVPQATLYQLRGNVVFCFALALLGAMLLWIALLLVRSTSGSGVYLTLLPGIGIIATSLILLRLSKAKPGSSGKAGATSEAVKLPWQALFSNRAWYRAFRDHFGTEEFPAQIILCGDSEHIPEARSEIFPPSVFPASRSIRPALMLAVGLLLVVLMLKYLMPPVQVLMILQGMLMGLVALVLVLVPLYWLFLGQTKIIVAPGVIQIVRDRIWRRDPVVRDYPITNGTVVVLRGLTGGAVRDSHPEILLVRRDRDDRVPLRTTGAELEEVLSSIFSKERVLSEHLSELH